MQQWAIFALFVSLSLAICASAWAVLAVRRLSVSIATALSLISEMEKAERLTPSKLAALSEFNEALQRAEELLLKVNRREIARAKRRADDGTFHNPDAPVSKDELRMRAGLRAGQPARHQ